MPVHGINWIDAVIWCNAYNQLLSEIQGLQATGYPYIYNQNVTATQGPIRSVELPSDLPSDLPDDKKEWKYTVSLSPNTAATTTYRLPTETEWEFAARGGKPGTGAWIQTYAGSNNVDTVAWWGGVNEDGAKHLVYQLDAETQPVKRPVTLGTKPVYHMSGNVWEWCLTDDFSYIAGSNLVGKGTIEYLKRGGSFNDNAEACETSSDESKYIKDTDEYWDTGFRLVRTGD
jgi:formylglycine-generating enzyme required for sulfatase activity